MTSIKKNLIDNDNYRVSQSPDCDNLTKSLKARKREREGGKRGRGRRKRLEVC